MTTQHFLELRGITKNFSGVIALSEVNLTLKQGEILALLGENGAGKSTLMKILSGVYRKDAGQIFLSGKEVDFNNPKDAQQHGISIIFQEFSLVPHLNVYENLFLGHEQKGPLGTCNRRSMVRQAGEILQRLGIQVDVHRPVSQLSIAEQQFVEIAKALLRNARILILDEPTATLTPQESERLFHIMRDLQRQGVSMIFISHHLDEIFQIADRITCLRDGKSVGERTVKDCTIAELINLIVGRDVHHTYPSRLQQRSGEMVLEVAELQLKPQLPLLNFNLRQGEILGVSGLVGSGRTEAIRALIGADPAHKYTVYCRGKKFAPKSPADALAEGIGLLPEDRKHQGLIQSHTILYNISLANLKSICHQTWHFLRKKMERQGVRRLIQEIRIKTPSADQFVRNLSGGNQQKVVIAKWLNARCQILIFDEPTRGIDVGAKAEIYEIMHQLTQAGTSIIMISSELPEIIGMSDRVMVMRNNRIEHIFENKQEITEEAIMLYATGGHNVQ